MYNRRRRFSPYNVRGETAHESSVSSARLYTVCMCGRRSTTEKRRSVNRIFFHFVFSRPVYVNDEQPSGRFSLFPVGLYIIHTCIKYNIA